jgi:hypothetical protein
MGGGEPAEPGPEWAQPMSRQDADAFVEAVNGDLDRRGLAHTMGEGQVSIERNGQSSDYGLTNLVQLCQQVGRRDWSAAITSHFDNLFAAADADAEIREMARSFDGIRSMFKVRLYPDASLGGMEPNPPASWELAPGLTAAFVYDLPTTVSTANAEQVQAWGIHHDELLTVALDNLRADAVDDQPIGEGRSAVVACVADHFFAAPHALLLGERLPPDATAGAVFIVPHRHALLFAPMVDVGVVQSINQLIPMGVSMFQQGPGSISPGLYWWRDGSVSMLPAQFDGKAVQFSPPDEFVRALNALPAAG